MKTADLMDDFQNELQSCEVQFKSFGKRSSFMGACRTVKCKNDNVLARKILEEKGKGKVLVIDGGASLSAALMGDIIAGIASKNGWAGVIINGVIRDTVAIGAIDIGIKSLGSNPRKSNKEGKGEVDVPVSFGEVTFHPGDWVYSDEDGIVVGKRNLFSE